jgi:hypothetical protein
MENRIILPQRREGAKVLKKKFFSELGVFAPSREIFRDLVAALPRQALCGL